MGTELVTRTIALGYVRRSVIKHGDHTDSPAKQQAAIERICVERGWQLELYRDAEEGRHYSGRSEERRPHWLELKRQLDRPEVAAVVCASLDRLSRSPKDFFSFLDELKRHNVALVSDKERFDTSTAIGAAFLAILMVIASLESDIASERVSATIAHRQSRGIHWGSTPYGYSRNGNAELLENDDAPVVSLIYDWYGVEHLSYYGIAQRLNALGHRMTNRYNEHRAFDKKNIRVILQGHWLYRGWVVPGGVHGDAIYHHDETRPPAGAVRGQIPPLITEQQAQEVARMMGERQRHKPRRTADQVYILTPLLHCALCGAQLRGQSYRDRQYYVHRTTACIAGRGNAPATELEALLTQFIEDLHLPTAAIDELHVLAAQRREQAEGPELVQLRASLVRLESAFDRLRHMYRLGDMTAEEYERSRQETQAELTHLQAQLPAHSVDPETILRRVVELAALYATAERPRQKEVVGILFERLETKKDGAGQWTLTCRPNSIFRDFF